ncbi:uncharacterized protein LOC134164269 [Pezoporus occidentalis]|uniref:uncharacterized protein LOC134164269 n=1 Tax=Pezoporus occidentalis TaxID=407982 RepID=UPI002F909230
MEKQTKSKPAPTQSALAEGGAGLTAPWRAAPRVVYSSHPQAITSCNIKQQEINSKNVLCTISKYKLDDDHRDQFDGFDLSYTVPRKHLPRLRCSSQIPSAFGATKQPRDFFPRDVSEQIRHFSFSLLGLYCSAMKETLPDFRILAIYGHTEPVIGGLLKPASVIADEGERSRLHALPRPASANPWLMLQFISWTLMPSANN